MPPSYSETTTLTQRPFTKKAATLDEGNPNLVTKDSGHSNEEQLSDIQIKINGRWLLLNKEFVANHPGGSVINQYKNAEATHIFHAFHEGSETAYKQLKVLERLNSNSNEKTIPLMNNSRGGRSLSESDPTPDLYDMSIDQEMKIVKNFEELRKRVHREGLMNPIPSFYAQKVGEIFILLALVFSLQYYGYYLTSALCLAISWQQLGWMTHEFCHHQPSKNRRLNNWFALFFGNIAQGFSRDWWKDKHNEHHAATNIVDQDGDIDLAPLVAMVPNDLRKYKHSLEKLVLKIVPYQHLYFTLLLPLLRISWTSQSIQHVLQTTSTSPYTKDRKHAREELIGIAIHWTWVLLQLYLLPNMLIRILYFLISQLGGGLLIAVVVTFNHNSVNKFPENSRILNNFAALHILTTRNMYSTPFIDWFWGGLNFQIEHHLFPTMPRPNLNYCSVLVQEFCKENNLPYLIDDYQTGYMESLRLLKDVANVAKNRK